MHISVYSCKKNLLGKHLISLQLFNLIHKTFDFHNRSSSSKLNTPNRRLLCLLNAIQFGRISLGAVSIRLLRIMRKLVLKILDG